MLHDAALAAQYRLVPVKTEMQHAEYHQHFLQLLHVPEAFEEHHFAFIAHGKCTHNGNNDEFAHAAQVYVQQHGGSMHLAICGVLKHGSKRIVDALQDAIRVSKLLASHAHLLPKLPQGHGWRMKLHQEEAHKSHTVAMLRSIARDVERGGLGQDSDMKLALEHVFSISCSVTTMVLYKRPPTFFESMENVYKRVRLAELEESMRAIPHEECAFYARADRAFEVSYLTNTEVVDERGIVCAGPSKGMTLESCAAHPTMAVPRLTCHNGDEVMQCVDELIYILERHEYETYITNERHAHRVGNLYPIAMREYNTDSDDGSDMEGWIVAASDDDEMTVEEQLSKQRLMDVYKKECKRACAW